MSTFMKGSKFDEDLVQPEEDASISSSNSAVSVMKNRTFHLRSESTLAHIIRPTINYMSLWFAL